MQFTVGNDTETEIIPEVIEWADLSTLPISLASELADWANSLEYQHFEEYDAVVGHNFVKELPTDWANHLLELGIGRHEPVLDVGTGSGRCRLSAIKGGFTNVYGLDSSEDALRRQVQLQEALGFEIGRNQLLTSVPESMYGSFGAVCLSSALHHIPNLDGFFWFASKLLRDGGVLIASAEPANMRKFNVLSEVDTKIGLRDVVKRMRAGSRERTPETTLIAEFHVGAGFSRNTLEPLLSAHNLAIEGWNYYNWTSYIAYNYFRNHLKKENNEEFMRHYKALCEFDDFVKRTVPAFVENNFFTLIMVARKRDNGHYRSETGSLTK